MQIKHRDFYKCKKLEFQMRDKNKPKIQNIIKIVILKVGE